MVFDSWGDVGRVLVTGVVVYAFLVLFLRVSGKRTLAKLNAFDLVVTVALGSVLATVLISRDVSWLEAFAAIAVLVLGQFVVAWGSVRWSLFRRAARSEPANLAQDGRLLHDVLDANRVTPAEVRQAVRSAGYGGLDRVAAVVLETDGTLSVIAESQVGDGSALADVPNEQPELRR